MRQLLILILTTCARDLSAEPNMDFVISFLEIQTSLLNDSQSLEATQFYQEPDLLPIYPTTCNNHQNNEADNYHANCEPRPTLLKIHKPGTKWQPLFTTIYRCAGGCTSNVPNVTCQHTATESVSIPMISKICQNKSAPCPEICGKIQVQNHTQCKCACSKDDKKCYKSHLLDQRDLAENRVSDGHTTKKQDSTSGPCDYGHPLIIVTILATTLLATTVYLALKLRMHLSLICNKDEHQHSQVHENNPTTSEIEELKINWIFSSEQSSKNETETYQTVKCPPVCLSSKCSEFSTFKCPPKLAITHLEPTMKATKTNPKANKNSQLSDDNHIYKTMDLKGKQNGKDDNDLYEIMDFQGNQNGKPQITPQDTLDDENSTKSEQ